MGSWVPTFVLISKQERTHLSDPSVGKSERKDLLVHKYFIRIGKHLSMGSCLCVGFTTNESSSSNEVSRYFWDKETVV